MRSEDETRSVAYQAGFSDGRMGRSEKEGVIGGGIMFKVCYQEGYRDGKAAARKQKLPAVRDPTPSQTVHKV